MVQHCHGNGRHHADLLAVVFEYENHVEVLHTEADPLEVAELDLLQRDTEGRPGGEVDQAAGGRLQEDGLPVRNTLPVQM